ncbi:ATPase/GTPase, AAA15 family [Hymenobacter daecheongensis DSM 21074]|uniref:ATPase/GTPase, AAA15 family n=1 Tax=Hymenobacter daecheongensis DSM 21074 TaxID=1121955 RepID=A0A1M6K3Y6_9BACT|nr:AAA family ATPase [Hymenobacter daecheongensis]SHJ53582.1 ATPase/GTPase, AAA15 family [Hymenobacter daecheongensis DSM 21074]
MQNDIKTLRIQNFKSIKDVTMTPRRVNLIIGMPNVGKSNILEAMSLLGAGLYDKKKFMDDVLRYEVIQNLFYDNDTSQPVIVNASTCMAIIKANDIYSENYRSVHISKDLLNRVQSIVDVEYSKKNPGFMIPVEDDITLINIIIDQERYISEIIKEDSMEGGKSFVKTLNIYSNGDSSQVGNFYYTNVNMMPKSYNYIRGESHDSRYQFNFLRPPHGSNLSNVVQRNQKLRKEVSSLFKVYGLNLVLRVSERKFEIQKQVDDLVYNYPYSSIADTLQRIIFYFAAIESNDDSVILLEEPEAHSYPMYVSMLGKRMVESRNNQFFVATHSPYLITEVLEQMLPDEEQAKELAIFVAYYEDYQTKVKQLSDEEVRAIRGDSVDVFYNMARYIPRPANG